MDTKSIVVGVVIGAVVFGGGGYYAGTKHVGSSAGNRQFAGGGNFRAGGAGPGGAARGGAFVGGEIIAKDDASITVKDQSGSTKIILLSGSSQITKSAPGTSADLSTGTNVIVTGEQNTDGSMTAQTVQIRPVGMPAQAGAAQGGPRTTQ